MAYDLYEITKEIFDQLDPDVETDYDAIQLIRKGRHLFMSVNDRCGPPYYVAFDKTTGSFARGQKSLLRRMPKAAHIMAILSNDI